VTTTEAIVSDLEGCERLEQQQEQHGLGRADTKYVAHPVFAYFVRPRRNAPRRLGARFRLMTFDKQVQ
jgi:hypothetical protein